MTHNKRKNDDRALMPLYILLAIIGGFTLFIVLLAFVFGVEMMLADLPILER